MGTKEEGDEQEEAGGPSNEKEGECSSSILNVSSNEDCIQSPSSQEEEKIDGVYFFDNDLTVLPQSIDSEGLRHVKLFSNYIHFFPAGDFPKLEELEVSACPLELNSFLPRGKTGRLKRLAILKRPSPTSTFSLPVEITQQTELQSLTICHCSILSLGSHIEKLQSLVELDLSFNKIRQIPEEISSLTMLKTLKVTNNKLVELPLNMSKMTTLVTLDVSCNRLTSLSSLDLHSMTSLRHLNVQYNKLRSTGKIPEWLQINVTGNEQLKLTSLLPSKEELSELNTKSEDLVSDHDEHTKRNSKNDIGTSTSTASKSRRRLKRQKQTVQPEKLPEDSSIDMVLADSTRDSEEVDNSKSQHDNPDEMLDSGTSGLTNAEKTHPESGKPSNKRRDENAADENQPSKRSKADEDSFQVSMKYRRDSFCGFDDYLPDGFYDAGKDRPFVELDLLHKEELSFDTREILLVDRKKDEILESVLLEARDRLATFLKRLKLPEKASIELCVQLATLVSEKFGGPDNVSISQKTLRAAFGVTTSTSLTCLCYSAQPYFDSMVKRCREAVNDAKRIRRSNIVPIGWLVGCGICRHRAVLFKYLCDRSRPVIRCELIRGYLDNVPHAWNVVLVPPEDDDGAEVRMVVDACRPTDIRAETDPEYFSRYIPMRRLKIQHSNDVSVSFHELIGRGASKAEIRRCNLGQLPAVAKVIHLENIATERWLSELRMYCAIGEHQNVVLFYGHQISLEPTPQMVIFMEYIKGGSLLELIAKYAGQGHRYMPPDTALLVAENVARGLDWLHSRKIIHCDIKSCNVLVDMESDTPLVKICDFDTAIPLITSSSDHTCYLASYELRLRVGTPRWVAPEVLNAISKEQYGLEADMWSFGCLILELLTLQPPYVGSDDSTVLDATSAGKRPSLTWDLEELTLKSQEEKESLQILIDLYESCTEIDPTKRPLAREVLAKISSFRNSALS